MEKGEQAHHLISLEVEISCGGQLPLLFNIHAATLTQARRGANVVLFTEGPNGRGQTPPPTNTL